MDEAVNAAAPKDEKEDADEDERQAEAHPEAQSAPMSTEAEIDSEGEAKQPVGGEVAEHWCTGISGTAKTAGGDGLDTVEELESSTCREENDGIVNDRWVGGVNTGNVTGEDEQGDAHAGHEGSTENNGGVAREAGGEGITPTDGLADTDGCSGGDSEGDHVSESDGIEGDLVRSEGNSAKSSDEGSDGRENGDFGGELEGCGKSESDELADALEIGLNGSIEELGFVARIVPEQIAYQDRGEIGPGDRGGPARASDAENGETKFAEDKYIIAEKIDEVGSDEGKRDGPYHVHALKSSANGEIEKQGKETTGKRAHIGGGEDRHGVGHTESFEIERDDPDGKGKEWSDGEAEVNAVDERAVAILAMACAEGLGDKGVQANHETFAKEGKDDEEAGADAHGTDGFGAKGKASNHHGVDDDHTHPAEFSEHQGEGEVKSGAKLGTEC
jgi:hypothetical protein